MASTSPRWASEVTQRHPGQPAGGQAAQKRQQPAPSSAEVTVRPRRGRVRECAWGHRVGAVPRRQRRHQQTREEILDTALLVMAEHGVAGLNLSEVAARIGLRQPSLYSYFPSRLAVYDAPFQRGMRRHLVRFAVEDPVLASCCSAEPCTASRPPRRPTPPAGR